MQIGAENTGIPSNDGENNASDGLAIIDPGVDTVGVENATVVVVGEGQVETINDDRKTDLSIAGSNHTINIESNIGALTISGSNSILRFSANVTVDECSIIGSDNTAQRAENVTLDCVVVGSGNSGFQ